MIHSCNVYDEGAEWEKKKKKRAAKCLYGCKCQIGHFESLQQGVKTLGIFIERRQRELANASRLVRGVFFFYG